MHKSLRKMRQYFAIDLHALSPLCRVTQATTSARGVQVCSVAIYFLQVFDHIPRLEACGAGLAMRSNGFAALNAIDSKLCQTIAKLTCSLHTGVMRSLDGTA